MFDDLIGHTIRVNVDSPNQCMESHISREKKRIPLIGSDEAAKLLGISLRTLYSYVSRGRIGRVIDPVTGNSQYNRAEVEEYARKRDRGRSAGSAARASLSFGLPVMDSQVCAIKAGRPWFRGQDAIAFSATATLEQTAALLWDVDSLPETGRADVAEDAGAGGERFLPRFHQWLLTNMDRLHVREALSRDEQLRHASRILRAGAILAVGDELHGAAIHEAMARAWGVPAGAADIIRRALVLHADHELNPSSFALRCVASTMASPYAATLAGCCAASGVKHANFSAVMALTGATLRGEEPAALVAAHMATGQALPGFNHPLYPKGDPRATALLDDLRGIASGRDMARIDGLLHAAHSSQGLLPKNDFALAAVTHLLRLPTDACERIFVVSRIVGWNAHALEQYSSPLLIRPRARYVPD
ncbi:helix-turn-helix domain-containing protein [Achromobacter xylosoxidans]|uniref:citrate synthase family protein n=2 Tax=Alcaligenes xylosoxydans xylosoxydans TaxID=85698 RepID=UPI000FDBF7B0|nr:citrate synthase family protein [Achromobacter xylosoxidans]KAA5922858.1 helix-turn-helix domain-containing protein [Achromobacter xylosoxidans]MCH4594127.1 citrate synthase family protein [Achromobacter xylosoxidans]MCM2570503.1 citrate synthase family protein [Achromobacter xylosoxidans]MCZ8384298.1 citrate synthase family protein [Achromobacter xylosoxidans]MEC6409355.1 citrate synthase family protein [Achromobacter xylosoxidans]